MGLVLGLDEVGRGCLAGPVVAACTGGLKKTKSVVRDSKSLSALARDSLYEEILEDADFIGLGWATALEIDQWNIRVASLCAMARSLLNAIGHPIEESQEVTPVVFERQTKNVQDAFRKTQGGTLLIDGRDCFRGWIPENFLQQPIIKGDTKIPEISAASIVAKVFRDRWMEIFDLFFPNYGLSQHKGYGSVVHRKAISKLGISKLHRRSFRHSPIHDSSFL